MNVSKREFPCFRKNSFCNSFSYYHFISKQNHTKMLLRTSWTYIFVCDNEKGRPCWNDTTKYQFFLFWQHQYVCFKTALITKGLLTMISSIRPTNNGWVSTGRSRDRESVRQTTSSETCCKSSINNYWSASSATRRSRNGARTRDDKSVEVQTQLKGYLLIIETMKWQCSCVMSQKMCTETNLKHI